MTEIPTAQLRAKTASISIGLQSALFVSPHLKKFWIGDNVEQTMWGFVLPYLFNPDKANLGAKVTFIFGALSVLSIVYLFLYQPESAGLSYEKLDELFMGRVKARMFQHRGVQSLGNGGAGEEGTVREKSEAVV